MASAAASRKCSVSGCNLPATSRAYCAQHTIEFANKDSTPEVVVGVDDMVLLPKVSVDNILKNLKSRFASNAIYTYIGSVLISVNPFQRLPLYTPEVIENYIGRYPHEVSPHVFAVAEAAFRNMLTEEENQAVIISGESGAGKTEVSKQIMQYISAVSGNGSGVERVKNVIIDSNPLLEAFGNAKTLRNNNSSRFGKYFEIKFDLQGQPRGGAISNYLLEKSRVVYQQKDERNYHIFYQLLAGAPKSAAQSLGLASPDKFEYLKCSQCYTIDDVDDQEDFAAVRHSMKTIGIGGKEQQAIFTLVASILHIGNIKFVEDAREAVTFQNFDQACGVEFVASLLQIDPQALGHALTHRHIVSGGEEMDVNNNEVQAIVVRDALSKALYSRLFDWLVQRINSAIVVEDADSTPLSIGVLDIYGFEIFNKNGFEQFCINFVNEKLQQIFIQLTLQQEQEEYVHEGIEWKPIEYFNNKIVCELIEGASGGAVGMAALGGAPRAPGILSILDDVCATMHAAKQGADKALVGKLAGVHAAHPHCMIGGRGFTVKHYAGDVAYDVSDFADKNKDTLNRDVLMVIKASESPLVQVLFEDVEEEPLGAPPVGGGARKRPTTAGFKIKQQVAALVKALSECDPHYVRCIKPNDEKKPKIFTENRVHHQITYLGLMENIKVRRAGFAARLEFPKFLERFKLCSPKTWPSPWMGSDRDGCRAILKAVAPQLGLQPSEAQLGKTKLFLKHPETIFAMEELKNTVLHTLAAKIQRCWRRYVANKKYVQLRMTMSDYLIDKKERRRDSIYRPYSGEYVQIHQETYAPMREIIDSYEKEFMTPEAVAAAAAAASRKNTDRRFRGTAATDQMHALNIIFSEKVQKFVGPNGIGADESGFAERIMIATENAIYFFTHLTPASGSRSKLSSSSSVAASAAALDDSEKKKKKKKKKGDDGDSKEEVVASASSSAPNLNPDNDVFLLRRCIPLTQLKSISMSTLSDNVIVLHASEAKNKLKKLPDWIPDGDTSTCMECGIAFSLFNRRHHCRLCGRIFCGLCSCNHQPLPDFDQTNIPNPGTTSLPSPCRSPYQTISTRDHNHLSASASAGQAWVASIGDSPVYHRVCDDCFGRSCDERIADHVLVCDKKTELAAVLIQHMRERNGGGKKALPVSFSDSISAILNASSAATTEISIKKRDKLGESNQKLSSDLSTKLQVEVGGGLSAAIVREKRAAEERRRAAAAAKRAEEAEYMRAKAIEREQVREADRRLRVEEKKRRKAEARAREQEEEAAAAAAAIQATSKTAALQRSASTRASSAAASSSKVAASAAASIPQCATCGCNDFLVNAFKPGKCNNCFHAH